MLHDIHGGIHGSHISHRALVGKAFRQGFYWPTALQDATELVKTCESCQFFAKQIHQPTQALNTIPLSWPFTTWGFDILGPFPKARGGYRFLIVAIDTFTKWVEVEPVGRITKENTVKFLHGIVMRFGVTNRLISDNGTQFISKKFENLCAAYGIKHPRSSVNHPMTNGNVERANGIILQGIKTRIFDKLNAYDKKWV